MITEHTSVDRYHCILFSIIISSFDFILSKSLISRSKKKSPATMSLTSVLHKLLVSISLTKIRSTQSLGLKDVRPHCYCASLVRTLYMTWRVPRHFQERAPSRNSTKYRADDLCGNFISEHFCWMLGDPHFFFGKSLPFPILSIVLKKTKKSVRGKF